MYANGVLHNVFRDGVHVSAFQSHAWDSEATNRLDYTSRAAPRQITSAPPLVSEGRPASLPSSVAAHQDIVAAFLSLWLAPSPTPLSHQMLLLLPPRLSPRSSHFPSVRSDLKTRVFVPASSTLQPPQHSGPRDTRRHESLLSFPQSATRYIFLSR